MIAEIRRVDGRAGIVVAVLLGMTIAMTAAAFMYPSTFIGYDIQAFWCGGRALLQHANPYLNQPLHACEVASSPALFAAYPQVTVPVPLPAYAIALFMPFGLLPFVAARALWWIICCACAFAIGRGISAVSGMPPATAMAASALAVLGPAIFQGALAPLPIALTLFAAIALRRSAWNGAALLLGCAMIEPHMALPACVAVALFVPQMRLRLLAAGACAAGVSLALIGPHAMLSYFTTMLPLHAASEVNNLGQDSLTAMLYHLGVAPAAALRLGSLQYVVFAIVAVACAQRLRARERDLAWLILLPAAFAVTGGTFIHLDEMAMIVPLGCLFAMRRRSVLSAAIVVFLALPSESIVGWLPFCVPAALVCCWLMQYWCGERRLVASGIVPIAATVAIVGIAFAAHAIAAANAHQALTQAINIPDPGPSASASVTWGAYNALSSMPVTWWPEKLLTIVPILLLAGLCVRDALQGVSLHPSFSRAASAASSLGVARVRFEK